MPDSETSAIMKHCVVDLVDEEGHDVSSAFAICTESYQDNGYMKDGTRELTSKGEDLEREKENQEDHGEKVSRYEEIVGESVDRGGPTLVERIERFLRSRHRG